MAEKALIDGDTDLGILDLSLTGLSAQLPCQLTNLGNSLGWDCLTERREST